MEDLNLYSLYSGFQNANKVCFEKKKVIAKSYELLIPNQQFLYFSNLIFYSTKHTRSF